MAHSAFDATARAHLGLTLPGLDDPAPTARGKVRDIYARGARELLLVATDRVSAFDVVLGTIPFKGALLTAQAAFWLKRAQAIVPTHLVEQADAQVLVCRRATTLPIELVVRGYLAGSLLREDPQTRGSAYGVRVDPALGAYEAFAEPLITPTTKEAPGVHDQPLPLSAFVSKGLVTQRHLDTAVDAAWQLFAMGQAHARAQGLLLVDTKYEFGIIDDEVVLIDELHTADSSRFWRADSYAARLAEGKAPDMLDKERLRRWLLAQGYSGNGTAPVLTDDVRVDLSVHYHELSTLVLGAVPELPAGDARARVHDVVVAQLAQGSPAATRAP